MKILYVLEMEWESLKYKWLNISKVYLLCKQNLMWMAGDLLLVGDPDIQASFNMWLHISRWVFHVCW
jgi:hypothetical protein